MRRLDHVVLHVGTKTVLRPEDRRERDLIGVRQTVNDMNEASIDGGVIANDADAAAAQPT
jgi:hypothetical protein